MMMMEKKRQTAKKRKGVLGGMKEGKKMKKTQSNDGEKKREPQKEGLWKRETNM